MQIRSNSVMTIDQARKLLGDEALSMTDEEVQQLIDDFDMIAQFSIKLVQSFKDEQDGTD